MQAAKIYIDLLNELQAAADTLIKNKTQNTFGAYDIIYKGSNALWIKFANSLRSCACSRVGTQDTELYHTHFEDALSKGVFESNADNAVFQYQATAPCRQSGWPVRRRSARHPSPSATSSRSVHEPWHWKFGATAKSGFTSPP